MDKREYVDREGSMSDSNHRYKLLDLARLYCALLIVIIHMGLGEDNAIMFCLSRQGVPFFFLTAGFFFAKKLKKEENNSLQNSSNHQIKTIISVYCFWMLLWLPDIIHSYLGLYQESLLTVAAVIIRRVFFAGMAPYWFLLVLAEGFLLIKYLIKKKLFLIAWIACIAGFLLCIIYNYQAKENQSGLVYRLFYPVFSWDCNVIMTGFPLIFLGAVMNRYEARVKKVDCRLIFVLYLSAIAASYILLRLFSRHILFVPFGVVQALLLFIICIAQKTLERKIPLKACANARNLSSVIYLTHTVFLKIFRNWFHIWNNCARYFLCVLAATLLYYTIKLINRRIVNTVFLIKSV